MELTLFLAVLTAVATTWLAVRVLRRVGVDVPSRALDRLIGAAIPSMFAGRLVAMTASGTNPIAHPTEVLLVRGGVDTATAALVFVAVLTFSSGHHIGATLDGLALPALAGLGAWHLGCTWRGACLGTASGLPWGQALPGSTITRHPVEIYAGVALLAVAASLAWWARRSR